MKELSNNRLHTAATASQQWFWGDGVRYGRSPDHDRRSIRSMLVGAQLRWLVRPWMNRRTPLWLQRRLTGLLRWTLPGATGVTTHRLELAGRRCDRHTPPVLSDPHACVLFFHGGGYTLGSPDSHRSLAQLIALDTGLPVYVPDYRLAPEHRFPAQLDDARAVVLALEGLGSKVCNMVFAGDSAGAHLALTLALARRDLGQTLPASLVLMSPCVDWTLKDLPSRSRDALLTPGWVTGSRDAWVAPTLHASALVSPIRANLRHLPPVLVQSASQELFSRDAGRLYRCLADADVLVTWQEWQGLWHDFVLHAAQVPEGRDAVRRCARFIRAFLKC